MNLFPQSQGWLLQHGWCIPKITCVEDGSKVSFKEKHDRARAVIGIQEGDRHGLSPNFI